MIVFLLHSPLYLVWIFSSLFTLGFPETYPKWRWITLFSSSSSFQPIFPVGPHPPKSSCRNPHSDAGTDRPRWFPSLTNQPVIKTPALHFKWGWIFKDGGGYIFTLAAFLSRVHVEVISLGALLPEKLFFFFPFPGFFPLNGGEPKQETKTRTRRRKKTQLSSFQVLLATFERWRGRQTNLRH